MGSACLARGRHGPAWRVTLPQVGRLPGDIGRHERVVAMGPWPILHVTPRACHPGVCDPGPGPRAGAACAAARGAPRPRHRPVGACGRVRHALSGRGASGTTAPSGWDPSRGRRRRGCGALEPSASGAPAAAGGRSKATTRGEGPGACRARPLHEHRPDAPRMAPAGRGSLGGERTPSRCRPVPNTWGGSVTVSSPARHTGPGGTTRSRRHVSKAGASPPVDQQRGDHTRGSEAPGPGA